MIFCSLVIPLNAYYAHDRVDEDGFRIRLRAHQLRPAIFIAYREAGAVWLDKAAIPTVPVGGGG